jgi:hypothetical protein
MYTTGSKADGGHAVSGNVGLQTLKERGGRLLLPRPSTS